MFSLESPHQGTKETEIIPNTIISATMGSFLLGTQERVRNSRGKQELERLKFYCIKCYRYGLVYTSMIR